MGAGAYCRKCGKPIDEEAVICPYCGVPQGNINMSKKSSSSGGQDTGSMGWGVLCFIFPLLGLILYLVWKDEKPYTADMAKKGALIGVGVELLCLLLSSCAMML